MVSSYSMIHKSELDNKWHYLNFLNQQTEALVGTNGKSKMGRPWRNLAEGRKSK
jgi:hypothetical protein